MVWQLSKFAAWHEATADDADRAAVAACREHFGNFRWLGRFGWLGERFAALEELLKR